MNIVERVSIAVRHNPLLKNAHWLWNLVRPIYDSALSLKKSQGLERNINGTDRVLIATHARGITEEYEPDVWASLMNDVRAGDTIADVGAYYGLYAIALAKRVGSQGRVFAFEPSSANRAVLQEHVRLNGVEKNLEIVAAAAGTENGTVQFRSDNHSESHIVSAEKSPKGRTIDAKSVDSVEMVTLDSLFAQKRLDILKIDVEGYEENVLRGAQTLLGDSARGPRVIYIEVHPYAWESVGTSSESLLGLLQQHGFKAFFVDGRPVEKVVEYGEIVARRSK